MRLVAIDTSSTVGSVAAFEDGRLVGERSKEASAAHGEVLVPLLDELLATLGWAPSQVARWAVDVGPGSFTGLRIGLAAVKGIVFATGAELVAVGALEIVAHGAGPGGGAIVSVLPAGKGEIFVQATAHDRVILPPSHLPMGTVAGLVAEAVRRAATVGATVIVGRVAPSIDWAALGAAHVLLSDPPHDVPRASLLGAIASRRAPVIDVDALEPVYVRPPEITSPKARTAGS